jgi:hypothetical protein
MTMQCVVSAITFGAVDTIYMNIRTNEIGPRNNLKDRRGM